MKIEGTKYYSAREYRQRAAWAVLEIGFRSSPRVVPGIRNLLLRMMGAVIGCDVRIFPSARIMFPWNLKIGDNCVIGWDVRLYNLARLEIGNRVVISQNAHLCGGTHDFEARGFPLLKREIAIEDDVWIAADAFIGPGVRVGRGAVVGARAVVVSNVPPLAVVGGNPARVLRYRADQPLR